MLFVPGVGATYISHEAMTGVTNRMSSGRLFFAPARVCWLFADRPLRMSKQPAASQWSRPSRTMSDAPTYPLQVGGSSQCPGLASTAGQRLSCLGPALVEIVIERANAHTTATTPPTPFSLDGLTESSVPYLTRQTDPCVALMEGRRNCHAVLATELAASPTHHISSCLLACPRPDRIRPLRTPTEGEREKEREREESNKVEQIYRTRA